MVCAVLRGGVVVLFCVVLPWLAWSRLILNELCSNPRSAMSDNEFDGKDYGFCFPMLERKNAHECFLLSVSFVVVFVQSKSCIALSRFACLLAFSCLVSSCQCPV
jgi:hypothetical protein